MKSAIKEHPSYKKKEWKLTREDRCDRCNAQAYVQIVGATGDLLFCSHHYNKIVNNPNSYTKMMSFMYAVLDERERLEQKNV